ncbi:MAG: hypothetical protein ACREEA_09485 [Stellaceae bacterium]
MARSETLAQACVEVTAVLSETTVASGRLAAWRTDEAIEIAADTAGVMVVLKAAGRTFAGARIRQSVDRLVATIIEVSDAGEGSDEWRFAAKSAKAAG